MCDCELIMQRTWPFLTWSPRFLCLWSKAKIVIDFGVILNRVGRKIGWQVAKRSTTHSSIPLFLLIPRWTSDSLLWYCQESIFWYKWYFLISNMFPIFYQKNWVLNALDNAPLSQHFGDAITRPIPTNCCLFIFPWEYMEMSSFQLPSKIDVEMLTGLKKSLLMMFLDNNRAGNVLLNQKATIFDWSRLQLQSMCCFISRQIAFEIMN